MARAAGCSIPEASRGELLYELACQARGFMPRTGFSGRFGGFRGGFRFFFLCSPCFSSVVRHLFASFCHVFKMSQAFFFFQGFLGVLRERHAGATGITRKEEQEMALVLCGRRAVRLLLYTERTQYQVL